MTGGIERRNFLKASGQLVAGASAASAAPTAVNEPAVTGYPNKKGLTIERVTYRARNMGTTIVANLFRPSGFDVNRKYAAVVVTHPFGGVKEQTSGLYAQHLAEQGFIALAYDASYQGESGGQPRLMEVPAQRLDDISCAIDFLVKHPQVDAGRIGSLGICAGGGNALSNAKSELRVKAVAAVSVFNLGEAVRLVPVVPDTAAGFTENTPQLYREGYDYYRTKADTLFWSEDVIKKAKEPKELHVIEGATHIDMYDRPQFVAPAVARLAAFFGQL